MKKIVCFLLVAMLAAMLPVSVLATQSKVVLIPSTNMISTGDTFTVTATLQNKQQISLATVVLLYNEDVLEMLDGTCSISGTTVNAVMPEQKSGTLLLPSPQIVSGELFRFTFRVKESASAGECEIGIKATLGLNKGESVDAVGTKIKIFCKHELTGNWEISSVEHWDTCKICGERVAVSGHQWGSEENACEICGYVAAAASEPTDESQNWMTESQETAAPSFTQKTPEHDDIDAELPHKNVILRWLIGAIVVVGCGFVATLFLYIQKNKKQEE